MFNDFTYRFVGRTDISNYRVAYQYNKNRVSHYYILNYLFIYNFDAFMLILWYDRLRRFRRDLQGWYPRGIGPFWVKKINKNRGFGGGVRVSVVKK